MIFQGFLKGLPLTWRRQIEYGTTTGITTTDGTGAIRSSVTTTAITGTDHNHRLVRESRTLRVETNTAHDMRIRAIS